MKADLHMHTTYSDGRKTMRELVDIAVQKGMDIIAITDHDTVGDIEDAITYGTNHGITVLPAIELSTLEQNKSVHVLGYFTDHSYHNKEMTAYYKEIKHKREERAQQFVHNLKQYNNLDISYDRVKHFSHGIIARPHIAKAINEAYPEYNHDDIFDRFIGEHCKAYVPSVELPVEEGIKLLKRNNCVTVLAHPTLLKPHIKETVLSYDYDGLEAIYFLNKGTDERDFTALAKERNMIITAGSDYHGIENDTRHGEIGDCTLQGTALEKFLKKIKKDVK